MDVRIIFLRIACVTSAVSLLIASDAFAHAAPAAPPIFDSGPCVRVIDREAEPSARFGYRVALDDVQLTAGDIALPDALTHQFFAFRGTISFDGFAPQLSAVDDGAPQPSLLPLWITRKDVDRAQSSSTEHMQGYDLSDLTNDVVLETMPGLQNRWLRITADDARAPITFMQALQGMYWDVRDAKPGLYTVAAYIFSPPYNGWEVRPGLVKLVSQGSNPPAAVIGRIQEALFAGQGRRVHACLDVPPDTQLRTFVRSQDQPESDWMPWGEVQPVSSGDVELCFQPPRELEGSMRVRIDLSAGGETYSFYSPDTVLLLSGESTCVESDTLCCAAAREPSSCSADGGCDAAPEHAHEAVRVPEADGGSSARAVGHGCSALSRPAAGSSALSLFVGLLWLTRVRRAQSRAAKPAASRDQ
jgi:hypothetical protein